MIRHGMARIVTAAHETTGTPRSTLKKWCAMGRIAGAIKIGNQWVLPSGWAAPKLKRGRPVADKEKS